MNGDRTRVTTDSSAQSAHVVGFPGASQRGMSGSVVD